MPSKEQLTNQSVIIGDAQTIDIGRYKNIYLDVVSKCINKIICLLLHKSHILTPPKPDIRITFARPFMCTIIAFQPSVAAQTESEFYFYKGLGGCECSVLTQVLDNALGLHRWGTECQTWGSFFYIILVPSQC